MTVAGPLQDAVKAASVGAHIIRSSVDRVR